MPTQMQVTPEGRYEYLLKTPFPLRERVRAVARRYNVSYNAALNILLGEALDAREALDAQRELMLSPKDS